MTEVSRHALKRALRDPVFVEALWLLIRLPQAAASKGFGAAENQKLSYELQDGRDGRVMATELQAR